jgi:hypothetical protein
MIFSACVDPRAFSDIAVVDVETRRDAEELLRAIDTNGVLLAGDAHAYCSELAAAASTLNDKLGQQIRIRIEEIKKRPQRYIASPLKPQALGETRDLIALAKILVADAVVVASRADRDLLVALETDGIEVLVVGEFSDSQINRRRWGWTRSQRLDDMNEDAAQELLGRVVRYAHEIALVDGQFGKFAKRPDGALKRHIKGASYVARVWKHWSPYRGQKLRIELLTIGGETGASAGHVSRALVISKIEEIVRLQQDLRGCAVVVTVKRDDQRRLLRDRYLHAKDRCWGVRHGVDCLGALLDPPDRRVITHIDPAADGDKGIVEMIRSLKDAQ